MRADELKKDVLDWIAENQNPNVPQHWLEIAKRLATYDDMTPAWRELAKPEYGIQRGRHIMSMAQRAADAANRECNTLIKAKEKAKLLNDVEKAARKLITAIECAPLPDSVDFIDDIDGKPMAFALKGRFAEGNKSKFPRIEMITLLEHAAERAAELRQARPARSRPKTAAFVRTIAAEIRNKTGNKMMGTIAHITNAALDLPKATKRPMQHSEQITKEEVESILRSTSR